VKPTSAVRRKFDRCGDANDADVYVRSCGELSMDSVCYGAGTYEVGGHEARDVLVSLRVKPDAPAGDCPNKLGTGPYVRHDESGTLHACVVRIEYGAGLVMTLLRAAQAPSQCDGGDWGRFRDEESIGASHLGQWLTVELVAHRTDLSCRIPEVPDLSAHLVDVTPSTGAFGIASSSVDGATYDDFVAISLK
jgi:hypothetical protein